MTEDFLHFSQPFHSYFEVSQPDCAKTTFLQVLSSSPITHPRSFYTQNEVSGHFAFALIPLIEKWASFWSDADKIIAIGIVMCLVLFCTYAWWHFICYSCSGMCGKPLTRNSQVHGTHNLFILRHRWQSWEKKVMKNFSCNILFVDKYSSPLCPE